MIVTDKNTFHFENIDRRVQSYIHHPFLEESRVHPTASRFHFEVANTILKASKMEPERAAAVLEALLLLETGLSIHDTVDDVQALSRQLHVLTGDYCSSQYYWILSRVQDEALLDALCEAVVEVNEAKMAWHSMSIPVSSDKFMELQEIIHGQLLFALADAVLTDALSWRVHIQSLVRAFVVKLEVSARKVPKYFTLRQAYDWLSDATERVIHTQANALIQPILQFVMDYLGPIQNMLESQTFAEGNR